MRKSTRSTRKSFTRRPRRSKFFRKRSVKKLARRIVSLTHEKKFRASDLGHKQFSADIGLNWTTFNVSLTDIPQGDTDTTRDGDRLGLRSIELDFSVYQDTLVTAATDDVIRIIVFQWYPATTPSDSAMLTSVASGSTRACMVPYSHDNRQMFRILFDRSYSLQYYGKSCYKVKTLIKRFPHKMIQYQSGTTTGTNKVYLMACTMNASAHCFLDGVVKTNFNDV